MATSKLTTLDLAALRAPWEAARAVYVAACDAIEAINDDDDPTGEAWDAAFDVRLEAAWALLRTPAPDAAAMAYKAAVGIDHAHVYLPGESGTDPATIARLLAEPAWDEGCVPATLYQDALRLAGGGSPLADVRPFLATAWLDRFTEAGGHALPTDDGGVNFGWRVPDANTARAMFAELEAGPPHERTAVVREARSRARLARRVG